MIRHPWYVPEFRILIDNEQLPDAMRASISSVSLQTGMEGADRVELSVNNESLRWLDNPVLKLQRPLKLEMGYAPGTLDTMFVGEIVSVEASFPSSGLPGLNVAAQDKRYRLQKGTKEGWFATPVKGFTNKPQDERATVTQVASASGLTPKFDPAGAAISVIGKALKATVAAQSLTTDPSATQRAVDRQVRTPDYDLLKKIAREGGYDLFVDHTGSQAGDVLLFFSPLAHLDSVLTLKYGESLVEFTPKVSEVGQVNSVTANVWDSSTQKTIGVTLSWNGAKKGLRIEIQPGSVKEASKDSDMLIQEPLTIVTAPRRLFSELMKRLDSRQTGSGSAVGETRIRTGSVLRLEGVGEQFGGFYRVTSARHRIDSSGYRTSFEVRKEIWFDGIPDVGQGAVKVSVKKVRT